MSCALILLDTTAYWRLCCTTCGQVAIAENLSMIIEERDGDAFDENARDYTEAATVLCPSCAFDQMYGVHAGVVF